MAFNFSGFFNFLTGNASHLVTAAGNLQTSIHDIEANHPIVQAIAGAAVQEAQADGLPVGDIMSVANAILGIAQAVSKASAPSSLIGVAAQVVDAVAPNAAPTVNAVAGIAGAVADIAAAVR